MNNNSSCFFLYYTSFASHICSSQLFSVFFFSFFLSYFIGNIEVISMSYVLLDISKLRNNSHLINASSKVFCGSHSLFVNKRYNGNPIIIDNNILIHNVRSVAAVHQQVFYFILIIFCCRCPLLINALFQWIIKISFVSFRKFVIRN